MGTHEPADETSTVGSESREARNIGHDGGCYVAAGRSQEGLHAPEARIRGRFLEASLAWEPTRVHAPS